VVIKWVKQVTLYLKHVELLGPFLT